MSDFTGEPPAYDLDDFCSSPTYSLNAGSSERVLEYEPHRVTGCPDCDWIFETRHMKINMGSRVWGLHAPSYGLNGNIDGFVVARKCARVQRITATLEGNITVDVSRSGALSNQLVFPLLSQTVTLYDSKLGNSASSQKAENIPFSISILSKVNTKRGITSLPPSFMSRRQDTFCKVSYTLKFEMIRTGMWKHQSKTIHVLYLPKTRPPAPPITTIPRPSRELLDTPCINDRVKSLKLMAAWPNEDVPTSSKASFSGSTQSDTTKSIYLSIPSPQGFTSGESIPFTLSLIFPDEPFLTKLYTKNIRIVLIKRIRLWKNGNGKGEPIVRDVRLSTAHLTHASEYMEGVTLLRGSVEAGLAGRETSWKVDGVAEVDYLLRVHVSPPYNMANHLPSFRHEEPIQITTDFWGTLDRELASTGGIPTPALGLASELGVSST